ncbi:hypothetical protein CVT26_008301 [Gymnopilus dilepis]|uniref:AB hydrolase-1 domain-containing protein n=1 Tax=Gymnopilus dilepis TaxID=231916 RepID=A0A409WPG8_9AGAR|nr:hypothetical protein CVT26_008301 [Gymnopilus dilepis]
MFSCLTLLFYFFVLLASPLLDASRASALTLEPIRSTVTKRGFVYSYYYSAPRASRPTILFLHGFPSTHEDWSAQISYFSAKGYGIIAPDLLGFGGTSAPEDVNDYKILDIAGDVADILSHQKVNKVIGVAHDWGSVVLARLLNAHIDLFSSAAFLSVGYLTPQPNFNFDEEIAELHQLVGYDVYGYMKFFAEDDAASLTLKHLDSFYSLFFPSIPLVWKTDLAPLNKTKLWLEENRIIPRARYWTAQQENAHQQRLLKKGLKAPLLWYRGWVEGLNNAGDASYNLTIPVFYGATLQDYVNLPSLNIPGMQAACSNLVVHDFNTTHWPQFEVPNEVNQALGIFSVALKQSSQLARPLLKSTMTPAATPEGHSIRSTVVRRGFLYSYLYKSPGHNKPTILFVAGFPSTRHEWDSQVAYFSEKGYGIIAPDLLGYGGTSAPENVEDYKLLDMAEDVIDILDHAKVHKVIGVGHDWGSMLLSRLVNVHVDRFLAAAFLSVGYNTPRPNFNFDEYIKQLHQEVGYDVFGYMKFLAEDDAADLITKHLDSFYSLFFPSKPLIWKTDLAPLGRAKKWIEENKQLPRPAWWTAEKEAEHKKYLSQKGIKAPLLWYRSWVIGGNNALDATIPLPAYNLSIPVFYGPTLQDYVDLVSLTLPTMRERCSNLVTHEFNTTHWVMAEAPDELNAALLTCVAAIITSPLLLPTRASPTPLDENALKSIVVRRGYVYSYFHKSPGPDQPTILFLPGFPNTYHAWESQISYFSDRGYGVIAPDQEVGYDVFGYMKFLAEDDAADILTEHLDSFYGLFFPSIPLVWKTILGPLGKAKEWIEENRQLPRAAWWTAEQEAEHRKYLLQKGLKGPLLWYKSWVIGGNNVLDATIPLAAYNLSIPVFYGATLQDYVDLVNLTLPTMQGTCSNLVTHNFNTTHWVMQEAPDEVNTALGQFFNALSG